ncbi:hypothetical protein RSOLAG22IIIB_12106 [Rhizoctonia solani]|uniref:Uncharacterized protein n=1 Tax=Rhizoctonia solani TaxID=456999 RepID=A0A0K6GC52_9AGAM|nr:hypothetical protein RSOLAG22IIIB_12106 [Rhizoctonia solani]
MSRKITVMRLELELCSEDGVDDTCRELEKTFGGLRNASCLRELHVTFPIQPEEGERPMNAYDSIEKMGPHLSLEHIHISGIRINRDHCFIRKLAALWPNVRTLSMPSQSASLKELEEFARLPSLRHLTVNLSLKYPDYVTRPDFERGPLKTLKSSGPVRLSTSYKDLSLSANALLVLWPSLERVSWSDEDPTRTQMADFFNSEVLRFNREFLFGEPRDVAQLSATKRAKEMRSLFRLVKEGLEEVDSDSDADADTDPEEGSGTE